MPPPKGKTNNPKGRPIGTPNKTTGEIKKILTGFISQNIDTMQYDFDSINEPQVRLHFMEKLMKYIIPTKADNTIEINEDVNSEERLELLRQIAERLQSK